MAQSAVEAIHQHISNKLDASLDQKAVITGIFGDQPSKSAKSPVLWNAAFKGLELDASFVPFDVTDAALPGLVDELRGIPNYLGGSVTMPYKTRIMELLDEIDPTAQKIGAVNTIARNKDGGLIGYNTDAQGAVDALLKPMPWQDQPFMNDLKGLNVLLVGAGGAAKAVAFVMADAIGQSGHITIVNRTTATAADLAGAVHEAYGNASSISESGLASALADADLVINASTRGQSGLRSLADGQTTCLEPYSSLAPCKPASLDSTQYADNSSLMRAWYQASLKDLAENQSRAAQAVLSAGDGTRFYDIIFAPLETTMLQQARLAGYETLNGQGMNLAQAVDGFVNRTLHPYLMSGKWDIDKTYGRVFEYMARVW
jgi:shikimate dehydrogenase